MGYDINCGVRLLTSQLNKNDLRGRGEELAKHFIPRFLQESVRVAIYN